MAGNPYHDKEGKFTSKDKQGTAEKKIKASDEITVKLKPGVDLSNFPLPKTLNNQQTSTTSSEVAYDGKVDLTNPPVAPTSLEDAMNQGNRILGSKSIFYKNMDLDLANTYNQALFYVVKDFPELFQDKTLVGYGDYYDYDFGDDVRKTEIEMCKKVLNRPEWQETLNRYGYSLDDVLSDFTYNMHNTSKRERMRSISFNSGGESIWLSYKATPTPEHFNLTRRGWVPKDSAIHYASLVPHSIIKFNKNYRNNDQINNDWRYSVATNYHFPSDGKPMALQMATHELGHFVLYRLGQFMSDDEWKNFWNLTDHSRQLYNSGQISGYAKTNRHEQVAEAFGDWYCRGNNATVHNKKLFNFLKDIYNRIYGRNK